MKAKRITIKDIARECNCSTATVSYVLNGVKNQKISEELTRKILQIANLYHYSASIAAKGLARGNSGLVGFLYTAPKGDFEANELMEVADYLAALLHEREKRLVLIPYQEKDGVRGVDSIIAYRLEVKDFLEAGNLTFAPIVSYGTLIENSIFYSLISNIEEIRLAAENRIILTGSHMGDEANSLPVHTVFTFEEAKMWAERGDKYLCLSSSLHAFLSSLGADSKFYPISPKEKLEMLLSTLDLAEESGRENEPHHLFFSKN